MSNAGVTRKAKVTWLKLWRFMVAVWKPLKAKYARPAPTTPPINASASDSIITETTTAPLPKPRARKVAISRVRAETDNDFVFPPLEHAALLDLQFVPHLNRGPLDAAQGHIGVRSRRTFGKV